MYASSLTAVPAADSGGDGGFWATAAPIIPHPLEFFFGLAVFGIIYLVVRRSVFPRLEQIYADRTAAIEGGIQKAEQAQAAAQAALDEYNQQLQDARTEASRIREDAKTQGAQILAEMRDRAQQESARITENAQKQIEAERQQALVQLRGEVGRLSTDLASRIVGESLQDEVRQRGIVERFLAELEAGSIAPERPRGSAGGDGTGAGGTAGAQESVGDARTSGGGATAVDLRSEAPTAPSPQSQIGEQDA